MVLFHRECPKHVSMLLEVIMSPYRYMCRGYHKQSCIAPILLRSLSEEKTIRVLCSNIQIRTTVLICSNNKIVLNELHSGKKIGGGKGIMFQMLPNFAEQFFVAAKELEFNV